MRRYQAIAQLYAANGRLQASLGFEPNLSDIQNTSLEDLTTQVALAMTQWQTGEKIKQEAVEIERSANTVQAQESGKVVVVSANLVRTVNIDEPVYQQLSWSNSGDVSRSQGQ
jgi:hypothetical protein